MTILLILTIILVCTIIFTAVKMRLEHKKELNKVLQIVDDRKRVNEK